MKYVLAMLGACLATAALSQEQQLSDEQVDVSWQKLQIMSTGDEPTEIVAHLKSHGISDEGANKLLGFTERVTENYLRQAGSFKERICSQATSLRAGGQEALAQYLEQNKAKQTEYRRRGLEEAKAMLSEADRLRLDHLLFSGEHGPKVNVIRDVPDAAARARTGSMTVEDALKRMECESTGEQG